MKTQDRHFAELARAGQIRLAVRSLCFHQGKLLVQRPADDPDACFAFPGGRLEPGDTFEDRLRAEYREELGAVLVTAALLFVVENRFKVPEGLVHAVEIFMEVTLASYELETREPHLSHHWLPVDTLDRYDLRPLVVRNAIVNGSFRTSRHMIVPVA